MDIFILFLMFALGLITGYFTEYMVWQRELNKLKEELEQESKTNDARLFLLEEKINRHIR